MRTVITYGTYDLFHSGHRRLLERARAHGDRLIVGVTSDAYDRTRGKLNVKQSVTERIDNIKASGLADEIVIEEYDGQKIHDIQERGADVFVIGSDWRGRFDYLNDYCDVVYLERTRGVSSTQLRNNASGILRVGLVGVTEDAKNMVHEARYVSGISVEAVWSPDYEEARAFASEQELQWANETYPQLLKFVDAVYISTRVGTHYEYIKKALEQGVHVLVEPPIAMTLGQTKELLELAEEKELALMEAIRTAYSPGFLRMVAYARSESIGQIHSVNVGLSRMAYYGPARTSADGGAILELAAYPLLAVIKLLGSDYESLSSDLFKPENSPTELYANITLRYADSIANIRVGTGVRTESTLEVAGTRGTLFVPDPWWRTQHFETHFEDALENQAFFHKFEGYGMRYELAEFASRINEPGKRSYKLGPKDSLLISALLEQAKKEANLFG